MKGRTAILGLVLALGLHPGRTEGQSAPVGLDNRSQAAVQRALAYLLKKQDGEGAIRDPAPKHATALTALSIMALASAGHLPGDPSAEGAALRRGIDFILRPDRQNAVGYYGETDESQMYGHAIVLATLCEMMGMGVTRAQNDLMRDRAVKAIALILRSQEIQKTSRFRGGWRYQPEAVEADTSVTVWQITALRAAKNAGFSVPKKSIDEGMAFLRTMYRKVPPNEGGFFYSPKKPREPNTVSMTAAGMLAVCMAGEYEAEEVRASADWLLKGVLRQDTEWAYYASYYYAQALHQVGGRYDDHGRRTVQNFLLPLQASDGSWTPITPHEGKYGSIYATAVSVLALTVPNGYLPIYQH